jgi:mannose-6-phosphate isomerase-like protein (cupin superfamily)
MHDRTIIYKNNSIFYKKEGYTMPRIIAEPAIIKAAGTVQKVIEEYFGRVNSHTSEVSIARMKSPTGWSEPAQTPEFDEYTIVLNGMLRIAHAAGTIDITAGQAVCVEKGEQVAYSTPGKEGADYIAVCLPAFEPGLVHRDS